MTNDKSKLIKYAINYLSKFNSSKNNLNRIIKNKIKRLEVDNKTKANLHSLIPEIINELENNNLINEKNYIFSKIKLFEKQGKSLLFIKNHMMQKGVDKNDFSSVMEDYANLYPDWEVNSLKTFIRKKRLSITYENNQKNLIKITRAGFNYELSKKILKDSYLISR
jgi:SOS response regulatory protein OraA/RecX